jgi:tetratricopeptide (TPR) repeat protein
LICSQATAQSKINVRKLENQADKAFRNKDYTTSLELFKLVSKHSDDHAAYYEYRIGMCLLSTDNKSEAVAHLENAKKCGKTSFVIDYYLGRAYMFAGRFDEAKFYLGSYARQFIAYGISFRSKEAPINEAHAIHTQKTMNDVYGFLAECDAALTSPVYSAK